MQFDKDVLIKYRLERCTHTIEDAKVAIENKRFHNAENRIYYAIYYVITALAMKNDFSTSKHIQLMGWFNKNYVKSGLVPKKLSKIYKNAFEKRQQGDYDDFINFSDGEVEDDYNDMIYFVEEVKRII